MRRWTARATCLALALGALCAAPVEAAKLKGTLELGDISLEQDTGDRSAVQETYNIYNGFSVSRILLDGQLNPKHFFKLDLNEINLDSRKGLFDYRVAGLGDVTARYDQNRQFFDPQGAVHSKRTDWRLGARLTPAGWLRVTADYDRQKRDGDRLEFPLGTESALGSTYDFTLQTGRFEAEAHQGGRGLAVGYDVSDYADRAHAGTDRRGHVVSARLYGADPFMPDRVTHFVRGAVGRQELTAGGLRWDLSSFQYVGVVKPQERFRFKYDLYLSRVDDKSTALKTDDIRNNFDLTWFTRYGQVFGGYSYVTNDDDRTLTSTNAWRAGLAGGYRDVVRAKVSYASSNLKDSEELTLLRDVEQSRFRANLQLRPVHALTLGGAYADRVRHFPLIDVRSSGRSVSAFGRVDVAAWGAFGFDYTYSRDKYDDLVGSFNASSNIVTGRVDISRVKDLTLSAAVSYLDIGKDLNIEKSILSFEGRYNLLSNYHVSVKYNVYNYDDYILVDRYYTANVVWVNFGYDFSLE